MLEESMKLRESGMVWIAVDPELDPLRNEPRFRKIVAEMKLDHVPPPRRLFIPPQSASR
jgi:hypothetical protein